MDKLVINSKTEILLNNALKRPSHSYLFVGKRGLGKTAAAIGFGKELIGDNASSGDLDRWLKLVEPVQGKKISITQIKEARQFCNLATNSDLKNKIILIDEAEEMSMEAYNCMLTILEEPPPKTIFIMVAHSKMGIPKTILSRVQQINFYSPDKNQLKSIIEKADLSNETIELLGYLPAKIVKYNQNKEDITDVYNKAKSFLNGGLIERLMVISTLSDKSIISEFINLLMILLKENQVSADWLSNSQNLILSQSHLYNNGNAKLVLENLALEFE
jgi:DNA polymerase III gamma/tau subunit